MCFYSSCTYFLTKKSTTLNNFGNSSCHTLTLFAWLRILTSLLFFPPVLIHSTIDLTLFFAHLAYLLTLLWIGLVSIPIGQSLYVNKSLQLMLPRYNPFKLSLMKFLYYPGAPANAWIFFRWRFVFTLLFPDSILRRRIFLDNYKEVHGLFQTMQLLHNTLYFLDCTLYSAASFVFVVLLLFWFSIFFCDIAGHCSIWSLVSDCSYTQQLSWACHFHFCRVIAVGSRSLQIFTSTNSLSILFRPRFKNFHAIKCTVLLSNLFFRWRCRMYFGSAYALMSWCWTLLDIICHHHSIDF